ncbi:MAG: PCRF domain-containing protein [Clostridia bacterium]|nr:PCRF domain-containing protein [Clostridia bacterium]
MDKKIEGLLNRYQPISTRYEQLVEYLESPEIIADNRLYLRYADEKNSLEESYILGEALKIAIELGDQEETNALYTCLTQELLPKNEQDKRGAIIELRAENPQSLPFLHELFRLYSSYAKQKGYKLSICEWEDKFISLTIDGAGAYFRLKGETGTHHSTGGKIGNSNVWVSVTPIMDDVSVIISDKDLKTDIFHSSGAGGQNINKVATAVRLTHIPSGIVVVCKEERSQLQNRNRAHLVLRSRLYDYYKAKEQGLLKKERLSAYQKSRTERIRLYDFDKETLCDLRLNLSIPFRASTGVNLDEIISPLLIKENKNNGCV